MNLTLSVAYLLPSLFFLPPPSFSPPFHLHSPHLHPTAPPYTLTRKRLLTHILYAGEAKKSDEDDDVIDAENPKPAPGAELPCAAALEFLADVYEREGGKEGVLKAVEVC